MEQVYEFLKNAKTYYLATNEGNQPRVRPFGTVNIFDGKLYIQTGKVKSVSKQIAENPQVELCAMYDGRWIRLCGTLVNDDRLEAKVAMLEANPNLKRLYSAEDENTQVLYFKDATATISSYTADPIVIKF